MYAVSVKELLYSSAVTVSLILVVALERLVYVAPGERLWRMQHREPVANEFVENVVVGGCAERCFYGTPVGFI